MLRKEVGSFHTSRDVGGKGDAAQHWKQAEDIEDDGLGCLVKRLMHVLTACSVQSASIRWGSSSLPSPRVTIVGLHRGARVYMLAAALLSLMPYSLMLPCPRGLVFTEPGK